MEARMAARAKRWRETTAHPAIRTSDTATFETRNESTPSSERGRTTKMARSSSSKRADRPGSWARPCHRRIRLMSPSCCPTHPWKTATYILGPRAKLPIIDRVRDTFRFPPGPRRCGIARSARLNMWLNDSNIASSADAMSARGGSGQSHCVRRTDPTDPRKVAR
jgi:hypothetical protein